ncbi:MAG: hypothetical protein QHH04_07710 [Methanolinea sp.]|jgi:hypothetical protein|nr:hypothetical protein [Methanolinea sp.]
MTILLRCRLCKGTGEIPNEQFRICRELKSHDIKKYFHMPTEDEVPSDDAVPPDACNGIPERVQCPVCEGAGTIEFDEEEWELRIVANEESAEE